MIITMGYYYTCTCTAAECLTLLPLSFPSCFHICSEQLRLEVQPLTCVNSGNSSVELTVTAVVVFGGIGS